MIFAAHPLGHATACHVEVLHNLVEGAVCAREHDILAFVDFVLLLVDLLIMGPGSVLDIVDFDVAFGFVGEEPAFLRVFEQKLGHAALLEQVGVYAGFDHVNDFDEVSGGDVWLFHKSKR